jgi:diguanylate cyclase (GGDEF)-like protein
MSKIKKRLKRAVRPQKLGHRLALYFISLSMIFTFAISAVLIQFERQKHLELTNKESRETIKAVQDQLVRSLWNVDRESTKLLLEGIQRTPSIEGLLLEDENTSNLQFGVYEGTPDFVVALTNDEQELGQLNVNINDTFANELFMEQIKLVGFSAALFIGLFGWFLQIIVRKLVTQHLSHISRATFDPSRINSRSYKPIRLDRKPVRDELADLVDALNDAQKQSLEFTQARESYENQLEYQANNDALTRLPNRRHIEKHLIKEMARIDELKQEKLAIFFIDLDGFKEVNDSLGHSVGDRVLKASAKRVKDIISHYTNGYVARFGGDEFIACCTCQSKGQAEEISEQLIISFRENFMHRDAQLQLGCSLGIVMFPDDGTNTEELIRKADTAMYQAKNSGRNTYAFFEPVMMQDVMLKNTIKNKLQDALQNEQLKVHYQPLIDLRDMSIVGFEALLRWEDKDLGQVRPDLFIPVAEQTGLIFGIDQWVLETATKQVQEWRKEFDIPFKLSINFSPTNFHHRQLNSWIDNVLAKQDDLTWVELEVTERLVLDYDQAVLAGIDELLKLGLSFSIDDFGTGYSSLGYIKKFSHILSKIKIDRLFVKEIINSSSDRALVKSIITLADSLDIEVLAEGVESRRQEEVLVGLGCDYAQGYLYEKPISSDNVPDFINTWLKTPRIVRNQ